MAPTVRLRLRGIRLALFGGMNRLVLPLVGCALMALSGCNPADTAPKSNNGTPTPEPTPVYSNDTYAKALKTASYRLRGVPPEYQDTQDVRAIGQSKYYELVDKYLDDGQNPDLGGSIRAFYRTMFMMGQTIDGTNYDQVPNLATYLVLNDLPVSEMLTAEYCVGNDFAQLADCTDGAPAGQRAGVISNKAFLQKYGQEDTVNMRRVSVVHQLFACGIYPDQVENPPPLARTNTPENLWPINDAGTEDPSDDFPDPGEGYNNMAPGPDGMLGTEDDVPDPIEDPAGPLPRLHKKYQSKLPSAAGARCHDCHGQLNARRPVFTFYAPDGTYNDTRSIGLNATVATDNVENPDVNGDQDYCSAITPGDDTDNMDNPNAYDCQFQNPPAEYLGQPMTTLKDFGAHIINRDLNDRFYTCMTTRHYNFILGKSQGELSMQAAGGSGPPAMAPSTLAKYSTVYEGSGWNTRELLRTILKGNEFLSSQGAPINQ